MMDRMENDPALDPGEARQVLRLAMHMGDTLLAAGMSANDVVVLMLRTTGAYRLRRVHIDVTYTSITATYYPVPEGIPVTAMRVVQGGVVDYSLVQALNRLAERISRGLPIGEAIYAYERLRDAPRPYPEWVATAASAGVAAAASLMLTSSWKIPPITFVTGFLVARVLAFLHGRRFPAFFQQVAAAALVTLVAAAMSAAAARGVQFFVGVDPTSVVVGGIIMLVAGMMFVGAAQDAIDEFYVTASARVFEVLMRTAGIVFGIVATLYVTRRLGIPVAVFAEPVVLGPLAAQYVGATLACAMFALSCYAPWKRWPAVCWPSLRRPWACWAGPGTRWPFRPAVARCCRTRWVRWPWRWCQRCSSGARACPGLP